MVFNKINRLNSNRNILARFLEQHPHGVPISAATGEGLPALLAEISSQLRPIREFLELSVPHDQAGVIARLHEVGQVIERNYDGDTARFKARIPPHLHEEFAKFFVRGIADGVRTGKVRRPKGRSPKEGRSPSPKVLLSSAQGLFGFRVAGLSFGPRISAFGFHPLQVNVSFFSLFYGCFITWAA